MSWLWYSIAGGSWENSHRYFVVVSLFCLELVIYLLLSSFLFRKVIRRWIMGGQLKSEVSVPVWKVVSLPGDRLGIKVSGRFGTSPWYVVEGPVGANSNDSWRNTVVVCNELMQYLNGIGCRPSWLADMYVSSPNCLESLDGTRIQAVGPMREVQDGSDVWEIDLSFNPVRNQMIHRLVG